MTSVEVPRPYLGNGGYSDGDGAATAYPDGMAVAPAVVDTRRRLARRAQLLAAVSQADTVAVTPWNDAGSGRALMDTVPEPAAIRNRREIPELGVTVVRFANGVEAWLKSTDFKNDEVLYSLAGPGGASLAPPEKFVEALLAPALVMLSGVGGHRAEDARGRCRCPDRACRPRSARPSRRGRTRSEWSSRRHRPGRGWLPGWRPVASRWWRRATA